MNDGSGLKYLLTDHLGSVVAITDHQGDLISQHRYLPFGGTRELPNQPTSGLTDYGYTGQRNLDDDIGLMDYKARFYSPVLNRFIQPDSIVPDPTNPQAWNRYSYVGNNPTNYNDPTGDVLCDADGYCGSSNKSNFMSKPKVCNYACKLGLKFEGDWEEEDKSSFVVAALTEAERMYDAYCPIQRRFDCEFSSAEALYRAAHGTTTLTFIESTQEFYCQRNAYSGQEGVSCYKNSRGDIDPILAAHEMGHVFNALIANNEYTTPYNSLATARKNPLFPKIGQDIPLEYRISRRNLDGEDFANMYAMWVYDDFPNTDLGRQREHFMEINMYRWITYMLNSP